MNRPHQKIKTDTRSLAKIMFDEATSEAPHKVKKTDTRSLARAMFSEAAADLDQIRSVRNAAYKSGFAMAAAVVSNYIRNCERTGQPISVHMIKAWVKDSRQWRNVSSLDDVPEIV